MLATSFLFWAVSRGPGRFDRRLIGTWRVVTEHRYAKNTMEYAISTRWRTSIFGDGTWQRKIISKTSGTWRIQGDVVTLTVTKSQGETDPVPENTRFRFVAGKGWLIYLRDPKMKMVRFSTRPTVFSEKRVGFDGKPLGS